MVAGLVLMFPGQGSQVVGMGADLCAAEPLVRQTFNEASAVLGYDLEALCTSGPAQLLARTDLTQPALLTVSVAIHRLLEEEGVRFEVALGHSLGEYSALVAAGAVSFLEAVRLVRRRGEEMLVAAKENPGGMAAVIGLEEPAVVQLCADIDGVWPANFNSPGQTVVSGTPDGLRVAEERAKDLGARRVIPLAVSGAFHSPLMEPALAPYGGELRKATWRNPATRFFSTCSLAFEEDAFPDLLLRQLVSPVRFMQAVKHLYAAGYDAFLEVGPGDVLGGLVRRSVPEAAISRISDVQTLAAVRNDKRYTEAF